MIFKAFLQDRFDTFSKGGGDWAPLAESTIRRRRAGKKGSRRVSILRDTGLLFGALDPTSVDPPGAISRRIPFGIEVGYGGPQRHGEGHATIADIASYHQEGNKNLPQRKIIVPPDDATVDLCAQVMDKAISKIIKDTDNDA